MVQSILAIDSELLLWIHKYLHNSVLDGLMVLIRSKWAWLPLYVFLLSFMVMNFGKRAGLWILFFIFTIAISDMVSTKALKYQVQRLRPCYTELVQSHLQMLVPCGGRYGFVSSHASNHFAMAAFLFFTLGRMIRRIRWPLMLWAASIAFAQVYVGVHYPLDVIAGGLLGTLIGWGNAWYYNNRLKNWSLNSVDRSSVLSAQSSGQ